jgi:hypothetical protein
MFAVRGIVDDAKCNQQRQQNIKQTIHGARNVNSTELLGAKNKTWRKLLGME